MNFRRRKTRAESQEVFPDSEKTRGCDGSPGENLGRARAELGRAAENKKREGKNPGLLPWGARGDIRGVLSISSVSMVCLGVKEMWESHPLDLWRKKKKLRCWR